jgi:hypothetical protein
VNIQAVGRMTSQEAAVLIQLFHEAVDPPEAERFHHRFAVREPVFHADDFALEGMFMHSRDIEIQLTAA